MVFLIIQSLGSDCVPVEQMLSSGCSAANRPLGTHNPSYYSLPTVFVLNCIVSYFSVIIYCICLYCSSFSSGSSLTFVFAEDWLSLCPYDCTVWEKNDFFVFWIGPDWSGFGQICRCWRNGRRSELMTNPPSDTGRRQSWRYWQGNSNRNFLDKIKMSFCHCCSSIGNFYTWIWPVGHKKVWR